MLDVYALPSDNIAPFMSVAASEYERAFDVVFSTLTWFPHGTLASLQRHPPGVGPPGCANIASQTQPSVTDDMSTLTVVANTTDLTSELRLAYRASIENLFHSLPGQPSDILTNPDVLCVAPGREGTLLAGRLGYLQYSDALTPQAKRIYTTEGMLIGLSDMTVGSSYEECVLIDGAIASGTTLIAIMNQLRAAVTTFHIYGGHSTMAGLWTIANYATATGLRVSCKVGHVSGKLNDHYYAINEEDGQLIIGDVGDTIAPIGNQ